MSSSQPAVLELAKQGNPKAISALINHQLQPKGIIAKAALKDDCLQIILESSQTPVQEKLVPFIHKGIVGLNIASIKLLRIYGRQVSEDFPAWVQEIRLAEQPTVEINAPSTTVQPKEKADLSNLEERAKQGDILALEKLINRSVQHRGITARLNRKLNTLQIVVESDEVPNKDLSVSIIRRELNKLKVKSFDSIEISGKQIGCPSDWNQKITFNAQGEFAISQTLQPIHASKISDPLFSEEAKENHLDEKSESFSKVSYAEEKTQDNKDKLRSPWLRIAPPALIAAFFLTISFSLNFLKDNSQFGDSEQQNVQSSHTSQDTSFSSAVKKAGNAAQLTQTAQSLGDWYKVRNEWQAAIQLMETVSTSSVNYELAEAKANEYQKNLSYAQQNIQRLKQEYAQSGKSIFTRSRGIHTVAGQGIDKTVIWMILPSQEWAKLSKDDQTKVTVYAESLVPYIRTNAKKYVDIPVSSLVYNSFVERTANLCQDCWAIILSDSDSQPYGIDRTIVQGDSPWDLAEPCCRGTKASVFRQF